MIEIYSLGRKLGAGMCAMLFWDAFITLPGACGVSDSVEYDRDKISPTMKVSHNSTHIVRSYNDPAKESMQTLGVACLLAA